MQIRYVLTGAPGSGKTTLADALRARGHCVIGEAASEIIARAQVAGVDRPWEEPAFVTEILDLQRERGNEGFGPVRFHDRGPLCTVALARWLGRPEPVADTTGYASDVFLVRPLGSIERTAARRISYADALRFEAVHIDVYREHGHRLIDVPPMPVADRVALIDEHLC